MIKVIKLHEDNLEMARCDACGCTLRFGFVVDNSNDDFRIVRIVCQCGCSVELEYEESS